jgi:hypothetical protein
MSLSVRTRQVLINTLGKGAADELAANLKTPGGGSPAAVTVNTVTATAGTLPTAVGHTTIANAASPTNAELLELAAEQQAVLVSIYSALKAHGIVS